METEPMGGVLGGLRRQARLRAPPLAAVSGRELIREWFPAP